MERRDYAPATEPASTVTELSLVPSTEASNIKPPAPERRVVRSPAEFAPLSAPGWLVFTGLLLAIAWLAATAAYFWGKHETAFLDLPPTDMVLALGIALIPSLGICFVTFFLIYVRQTQQAARLLADAAFQLVAPVETADAALASLGTRLRSEIERMDHAMQDALQRARELEKIVGSEVDALGRAGSTAANYASGLKKTLEAERNRLEAVGQRLTQQNEKLATDLDDRAEKLTLAANKTEKLAHEAAALLERRLGELRGAGDKSLADARNAGEDIRASAERLEKAAGSALSSARQSRDLHELETKALNDCRIAMTEAGQSLRTALVAEREELKELAKALRTESELITGLAASTADSLSRSFSDTATKAEALVEKTRRQSLLIGEAGQAAISDVDAAVKKLLHSNDESAVTLQKAIRQLSESLGAAGLEMRVRTDEFIGISTRLANVAATTGGQVGDIARQLLGDLTRLPSEAALAATAIRGVFEEQINALAIIAKTAAHHGNLFDASAPADMSDTPPVQPVSQPKGLASRLKRKLKGVSETTDAGDAWKMSDVLNKAEAGTRIAGSAFPASATYETGSADQTHATLGALEALEALSADIGMAFEDSPLADLWERFEKGERDVFLRHLLGLPTTETAERLSDKCRNNNNFKILAERYAVRFEGLLSGAARDDRAHIMHRTYMGSDIGRLYRLLCTALARRA
jgi:hypothetical protein